MVGSEGHPQSSRCFLLGGLPDGKEQSAPRACCGRTPAPLRVTDQLNMGTEVRFQFGNIDGSHAAIMDVDVTMSVICY